ncbi:MAG: Gfo/Idh/MocA family oxidoreductase [Pirellulaceae bacterium]
MAHAEIRIGIIGLDTSHAPAFAKLLNAEDAAEEISGCKVVAAYPHGSADIESSASRIPAYTQEFKKMGIEIVDSIPALLEKVDAVLLETNDGRPHLEQLIPVLKAGKPCFVDKPFAGSLTDAIAMYDLAKKHNVAIFSSSSLRYGTGAQEIRGGSLGKVLGADAYSPCSLEATHPDLFWYGIHGVESLFTVMGTGCETVTRASTDDTDLVVGVWDGGRVGTFRGLRAGKRGYGGTAFGEKGTAQIDGYMGYRPLLVEIVKFFRTGDVPISAEETLEIYAFMEAADESKRQGGVPVSIQEVMEKAKAAKPSVAIE